MTQITRKDAYLQKTNILYILNHYFWSNNQFIIYIIIPLVKKSIPCCLLTSKHTHIFIRMGLICKLVSLICAYVSPDSDKMTFSLKKPILWIEDTYFSQKQLKLKRLNDGFV